MALVNLTGSVARWANGLGDGLNKVGGHAEGCPRCSPLVRHSPLPIRVPTAVHPARSTIRRSIFMNDPSLSCQEEQRREDVRAASLYGLDYVEVTDQQQLTLNVFFLGKAPANIQKGNVVLTGGRRIRDVQITSVRVQRQSDPTLDDYLEIRVNKAGDFRAHTISVVNAVNGQPDGANRWMASTRATARFASILRRAAPTIWTASNVHLSRRSATRYRLPVERL